MFKKLKKRWKAFWKYYILGYYHCDECPMCWSEYAYEGDCDCGCYLFGDIRDTCRLLPPIRQMIGWPKKRKLQYWAVHQYDNYGEYWEQIVQQDLVMEQALKNALSGYEICRRNTEGDSLNPSCKADWIEKQKANIRYAYEKECHPQTYISLKKEWKNVLMRTWNGFLDIFRPYFCK